jgi:uridine kinase
MEVPRPRPIVIGIAGGSGSGKTTVAHRVQERFPQNTVAIIHHDCYYFDRPELGLDERAAINYDHPNAFETELLIEHIARLRDGQIVDRPAYDYASHRRFEATETVLPADILFVEGILVLESAALRDTMDIRLFVDVDADERFIRRMGRDITERGRDLDSVVHQYRTTVRPMHQQFVEPSKRYAQIIIPEGGHNAVAIDMISAKVQEILVRHRRVDYRELGLGGTMGESMGETTGGHAYDL